MGKQGELGSDGVRSESVLFAVFTNGQVSEHVNDIEEHVWSDSPSSEYVLVCTMVNAIILY